MLAPLILLASALVAAKPVFPSYALHERRAYIPSGWSWVQRHDAASVLPLRFGLAQTNVHHMDEYVNDVSHPDSPNYGNHWSAEKVAKMFAPASETVDAVHGWLIDAGFVRERVRVASSRGWIEVNATVEEAESLLRAEYHVYRHGESGQKHIGSSLDFSSVKCMSGARVLTGPTACDEYYLPEHVRPHVELVMPTVHFDAAIRKHGSDGSAMKVGRPGFRRGLKSGGTIDVHSEIAEDSVDRCDVHITPACLRRLYGIPDSWQPKAADRNSLGICRCLVWSDDLLRFDVGDQPSIRHKGIARMISTGSGVHSLQG